MAVEDRYSRQTLFPGIGAVGQQRLGEARVVVVGGGALGTVCAEMLVRAGVGRLRLIDRDFVEWSNLQRQSLFTESDAEDGLPKATAAARALRAINSAIGVEPVVADLDLDNLDLLCGGDLLLDGTDNFETRYLLNDYAVREAIPWVYGAAVGSYGLGLAVVPGQTPCLRCIFPELPPPGEGETCETAGVISPVIHMVAAFEVAAALRILVGYSPPAGLFQVDVWNDQWRFMDVGGPNPHCPCCAHRDFVFLRGGAGSRPERLCGRNAVQVRPTVRQSVDLPRLARQLAPLGPVRLHPELLRFSTSNYEITVFPDGRAIVKGTDNPAEARSVYARYVGA